MAHNFLEQLSAEWYEYQGYFVRRNVHVGKRLKGGYECELDVVAFHPKTKHLIQIEPSMDADSWAKRDAKYKRKFDAGKKYAKEMFDGFIDDSVEIEQIALLAFVPKKCDRNLGGGKVVHVSSFLKPIVDHFSTFSMFKRQIHEQYTILRTLQFATEYRKELY